MISSPLTFFSISTSFKKSEARMSFFDNDAYETAYYIFVTIPIGVIVGFIVVFIITSVYDSILFIIVYILAKIHKAICSLSS